MYFFAFRADVHCRPPSGGFNTRTDDVDFWDKSGVKALERRARKFPRRPPGDGHNKVVIREQFKRKTGPLSNVSKQNGRNSDPSHFAKQVENLVLREIDRADVFQDVN